MNISWKNVVREVGDTVNPFNGDTDYDLSPDISVAGGVRTPTTGGVWGVGAQGSTQPVSSPVPSEPNMWEIDTYEGGEGTGATSSYVDPYAQWGGQTQYQALRDMYNAQKQGLIGSANNRISQEGTGLRSGILDYIDQLRAGQSKIDNSAVNNELAKMQGTSDVYGMVGRGIQSGGVQLSNRNAADSSAAGQIARAYSQIGQRQLGKVGNQYELANRDIGLEQQSLDQGRTRFARKLDESQDNIVNSITTEAQQSLAALDAEIAGASLPDRIAIEQEKEAIRQRALSELQQYDSFLQQQAGGVKASSQEARRAEASRLSSAGTASTNPFQYSTEVPSSLQGTGPFPSELPIFTFNNRQRRTT